MRIVHVETSYGQYNFEIDDFANHSLIAYRVLCELVYKQEIIELITVEGEVVYDFNDHIDYYKPLRKEVTSLLEFQRIYLDLRKEIVDHLRKERERTGISYKRLAENAIEKYYAPKISAKNPTNKEK